MDSDNIMETDNYQEYPFGDYAPHVLSGAEARRQSGRRSPGLNRPSGCFPWYTTYMIDQGPFTLNDPERGRIQGDGPAVICLPPLPRASVRIPSSTLFSWLEWGAVRLPLCARETINASRKYPDGYAQPPPEEVWGRPMPLLLPGHCTRPTAGMMVRVNASWWKGAAERMLANAELALWIAQWLFPPPAGSSPRPLSELFPNAGETFLNNVQVLEKGLSLGLDIQDWASALDISPRTLQRRCQKETGQTPQEILDTLRLQTAEHLLRNTKEPLRNICRRCGFAGASAFSAWFAQKTGFPPSQWRTKP